MSLLSSQSQTTGRERSPQAAFKQSQYYSGLWCSKPLSSDDTEEGWGIKSDLGSI